LIFASIRIAPSGREWIPAFAGMTDPDAQRGVST
jgi:hypothetical protein